MDFRPNRVHHIPLRTRDALRQTFSGVRAKTYQRTDKRLTDYDEKPDYQDEQ